MPHATASRVSADHMHDKWLALDAQPDAPRRPPPHPRPVPMETAVAVRSRFQRRRRQHHLVDVHLSMRRRIVGSEVRSSSLKTIMPARRARPPTHLPTYASIQPSSVAEKATLGSAVFLGQLMGATVWGPVRLGCAARPQDRPITTSAPITTPAPITTARPRCAPDDSTPTTGPTHRSHFTTLNPSSRTFMGGDPRSWRRVPW